MVDIVGISSSLQEFQDSWIVGMFERKLVYATFNVVSKIVSLLIDAPDQTICI